MNSLFKERWTQPKSAPEKYGDLVRFFFDWLVPYSLAWASNYLLVSAFFSEKYSGGTDREKLLVAQSQIILDKLDPTNTPYFTISWILLFAFVVISAASQYIQFDPKNKLNKIFQIRKSKQLYRRFYWSSFLVTKLLGYISALLILILAFANAGYDIAVRLPSGADQIKHLRQVNELKYLVITNLIISTAVAYAIYHFMYRAAKPPHLLVMSITKANQDTVHWDSIFKKLQDKADAFAKLIDGFWTQHQVLENTARHGIVVMTFGKTATDRNDREKTAINNLLKEYHQEWKQSGYDLSVTGLDESFMIENTPRISKDAGMCRSGPNQKNTVCFDQDAVTMREIGKDLKVILSSKIGLCAAVIVSGLIAATYAKRNNSQDA